MGQTIDRPEKDYDSTHLIHSWLTPRDQPGGQLVNRDHCNETSKLCDLELMLIQADFFKAADRHVRFN